MNIMLHWQNETDVEVAAFVIMENHIHLVAVSPTETALGEFMGGVCAAFSRYFNGKVTRKGPNWERRYYAAPMDDWHTVATIRYIERNPVVAKMVNTAWDWHWSSARYHAGLGPKPELVNIDLRPAGITSQEWREELLRETEVDLRAKLKKATRTGRALGAQRWAEEIDRALGKPPARRPGFLKEM